MSSSDRERWNAKYATKQRPELSSPEEWLRLHAEQLAPGRALDLACGMGHNSIWLAEQGWQVDAVDISPLGLELAAELAASCRQAVQWVEADLDEFIPAAAAYDLVVVFRFLDRGRLPGLIESALRPGGALIYETFSTGQLARPDNRLRNPAFALQAGELLRLFPGLECLDYEERDDATGSTARLFARKPLTA